MWHFPLQEPIFSHSICFHVGATCFFCLFGFFLQDVLVFIHYHCFIMNCADFSNTSTCLSLQSARRIFLYIFLSVCEHTKIPYMHTLKAVIEPVSQQQTGFMWIYRTPDFFASSRLFPGRSWHWHPDLWPTAWGGRAYGQLENRHAQLQLQLHHYHHHRFEPGEDEAFPRWLHL